MLFRRTATTAAALLAVTLGAAACDGADEPGASADPTISLSPTPTDPTTSAAAWESKYTDRQLDAYKAALARWETYESQTEPIWAEGKATHRTEELFKQYFPSPVWQSYQQRLATYEQVHVHIEGIPELYWSKPKSISKDGRSVVIDQCVDYSKITTTQRGEPAPPVQWQQRPNLRTISLEMPKGHDWLIYGVIDATGGKERPCAP
jgi:hypothetical protein